jgi:hypothetical protein
MVIISIKIYAFFHFRSKNILTSNCEIQPFNYEKTLKSTVYKIMKLTFFY